MMNCRLCSHVCTRITTNRTPILRRSFANESNTEIQQQAHPSQRRRTLVLVSAAAASVAGASLYTRRVRREKLNSLTPAKGSGLLTTMASSQQTLGTKQTIKYNVPTLIETITRASLIGSTKSVKEELNALRKWHLERGYNGGLIVRDLSQPLFSLHSDCTEHDRYDDIVDEGESKCNSDDTLANSEHSNLQRTDTSNNSTINIDQSNQRECYYLYYEIHSNGETRQQLFCRGTTLFADIWTCLQTWFDYDDELGCRVHHGFNEHANRIVEDVIPLLVPPSRHATVEVCGHSLGGAVAMLVAIKLRKRGYFVKRVTSVAGPRFCRGIEERDILEKWLPKETIRIEDDLDIVTYLPPHGVSVGDKLWIVSDHTLVDGKRGDEAYMISRENMKAERSKWIESVWLNLRLIESLWKERKTHKVSSYASKLGQLLKDMDSA
jgi:hypothetical protein